MPDFEQRLHSMLDEHARAVRTQPDPPPGLLARARRRRARRATSVAIVAAVVVVAGVARLVSYGDEPETSVLSQLAPTTTATSSPTTSSPALVSAPAAEMFVAGRLARFSPTPVDLGQLPEAVAPSGPPIRTGFGVVAALGPSGRSSLWLAPDGAAVTQLAPSIAGLAVHADGQRVAWSEVGGVPGRAASSRLVVARLPDAGRIATTSVPGTAQVRGFVGESVLVTLGDGASTRSLVWVLPSGQLVDIAGFRTVAVTDPERGLAVLNEGDGPCGVVVAITSEGSVRPLPNGANSPDECRRGLAFSEDGTLLVTASADSRDLMVVTVEGRERLRERLGRRILQAVWTGADTFLVLSASDATRSPSIHTVHVCRIGASCEAAWDVAAQYGPDQGSVWLVQHA